MSGQTSDLWALTASELRQLLDVGTVRAVDIADAYLARISDRDGTTRAWAHLDPDHVLQQARDIDAAPQRGALAGIPIGIKDCIDTVDFPTSYGSHVYRDHRPAQDAEIVMRLRRNGALILGKTSTTEFMSPIGPPSVNPLDPTRSPGTSSSGSAAAVADHTAPVAIGTQTGGSVIRPASYCGVYGYKGRTTDVPRRGLYPLRPSLDSIGVFSRSLSDIELVWSAVANSAENQALSSEPADGIGVVQMPWPTPTEPATSDMLRRAADTLAQAGHRVIDLELPASFRDVPEMFGTISTVELSAALASHVEAYPDTLPSALKARVRDGSAISSERYEDARESVRRMKKELADQLRSARVGAMITASANGEAPQDLTKMEDSSYHQLASLLDLAALSIPFGSGPNGMPIGLQVISREGLPWGGLTGVDRVLSEL